MVRVKGPLLSITARGWFGRYTYARFGVVPTPYPIGLLGKIRVPYSLWDRNIHGFYKIPAFGLRPYPSFISQYYSIKGWCYQHRRTWHGMQPTIIKPPWSVQRNTPWQYVYKQKFADAVHVWQGMSDATRHIYHMWRNPVHASGYNRFLRWYLLHTTVGPLGPSYILLEDGGTILTEAGELLEQE